MKDAFPNLEFNKPLEFIQCNDGSNRFFVVEQGGKIFVIENNFQTKTKTLFLDISKKTNAGGECGLLSLAFDPDYRNNGYFYLNYTTPKPLKTVVARFSVLRDNPNKADESPYKILEFNQPYKNHNGGCIRFGNDGYLYIASGDGGSGGDPKNNAQNYNSLLGKILRIDVHNKPTNVRSASGNYSIPSDNPFVNREKTKPEIFALGFRNPWRFSFDSHGDRLWVGDVGQNKWEEVSLVEKGKNYGWRIMEGFHVYKKNKQDVVDIVPPVWECPHSKGVCVTGGVIYNGSAVPSLKGAYLCGDYGTGRLWSIRLKENSKAEVTELIDTEYLISSFGTDSFGEVYFCSYDGHIYKILPK